MKIHIYRPAGDTTRQYRDVLKAIAEDARTLMKQDGEISDWAFVSEFNALALVPKPFSNVSRR